MQIYHLIVAICMVAHNVPKERINKQKAPWEARTPDLEVNSFTLQPIGLRKPMDSDGMPDIGRKFFGV
jgi:hypothetical protein